jgi:hypothetical protein
MPAGMEPALALLKGDHDKVTDLFQRYAGLAEQEPLKLALARQICLELKVHTALEAELFYPALQGTGGGAQLVPEALRQHPYILELVDHVLSLQAGAQPYEGVLQQMREAVQQHVTEEEGQLFAQGQGRLAVSLADRLQQRKQQLLDTMKTEVHMQPPPKP